MEMNNAVMPNEPMLVPTFSYEITFVDSEPSPALTEKAERRLAKLEKICDRITDAKVSIRIPHKHHGRRHFHVHIQLDVPGERIVVSRETEEGDAHLDAYVAVRDAFNAVERRLATFIQTRRHHKGVESAATAMLNAIRPEPSSTTGG